MPEPSPDIGLTAETRLFAPAARKLGERFGLPWLDRPPASGYYLCLTAEGLELRLAGSGNPGPVRIDFAAGAMAHRLRFGGGRGQALARAAGLKPGFTPTVWDATAGLGRDGFVLASLGCQVTLCERSPVLAALLYDGLQRAALHPEVGTWSEERLRLVHADAVAALAALDADARPDVVYLDPMYPAGKEHVLVKKEMRALQAILGPDEDSAALLDAAQACARRRVVVKRPKRAPPLGGRMPSAAVESKKTRYDLYVTL
jgi:16S rRNA (guanine1516-N2)-methyltransferase